MDKMNRYKWQVQFWFIIGVIALITAMAQRVEAQSAPLSAHQQMTRDIFQQLIEINTTDSVGNTTVAAEAMAARLKAAGFPAEDVKVLGPNPRKGNLVVRFRGTGTRKPLLLLAHLDVVEALREDWSFDPFKFLEKDGYYYGRGTLDDKAMASIFVANLIRYKQEGFKPDRDIILALTADEEGGDYNGATWLVQNHRQLIDAEFGINEGAGGLTLNGKRLLNGVQASEKVFQSFVLEVKSNGGHSSLPTKDNAIYHLAEGLLRLSKYDFPVNLNEVTRTYFERSAKLESGQMAADLAAVAKPNPDPAAVARLSAIPSYNATMRTTCVATRLEGGHADNALPQTARALVNCRILPTETAAQTQQTLVKIVADSRISVTPKGTAQPSPPSPLNPAMMQPIEQITKEMWAGVSVVPLMSTGATDSAPLRNAGIPMYGVSGIFHDMNDVRMHGKDERIGVQEYYEGQEFLYRLVKALSSGK